MSEQLFFIGLFCLGIFSVIIFSFVVFYGAPFLPTKRNRVEEALDLLDLKAGQKLVELGSGDGRLLRAAARRGIYSIGYELNPVLVLWTRLRSWRQREFIKVRITNYWKESLPEADGIYVFLLQPYMAKLDAKVQTELKRSVKMVSFAFAIPGKKSRREQKGLFLYEYKPSR